MTRPPGYPDHPGYGEPYQDNDPASPAGHSGDGYADGYGYPADTLDRRWDRYLEHDQGRDTSGRQRWYPGGSDRQVDRTAAYPDRQDRYAAPVDGYRDAPGGYGYGGHRDERWPGTGTPLSEQPTTRLPTVSAHGYPNGQRPPRKPGTRKRAALLVGVIGGVVLVAAAGLLLVNRGGSQPGDPSVPPDLAHPTRVVDRWLTAMFIKKDPEEMLRYTCKREADRALVDDAIRSVRKAERDARVARLTMKVSWSEPAEVTMDDEQAKVTSTLTVTVGKRVQKTPAAFDLVFEAGWRVCDTDLT